MGPTTPEGLQEHLDGLSERENEARAKLLSAQRGKMQTLQPFEPMLKKLLNELTGGLFSPALNEQGNLQERIVVRGHHATTLRAVKDVLVQAGIAATTKRLEHMDVEIVSVDPAQRGFLKNVIEAVAAKRVAGNGKTKGAHTEKLAMDGVRAEVEAELMGGSGVASAVALSA